VKIALVIFAFVVALVVGLVLNRKSQQQTLRPSSRNSRGESSDVYLGLRNQILRSSRKELGITAPYSSTEPWGLLMDWKMPNGSATVVSLADGTASVYLSSGGGYIGGQSSEAVREAARRTVTVAQEFAPQMHGTTLYPLPNLGEVTFYALTDSGVVTTTASEADLRNGYSPLAKLGNAAQDVITQYRLLQEPK
jgi:hypothetical protein